MHITELNNLLLQCTSLIYETSFCLIAPNEQVARNLKGELRTLAALAAVMGKRDTLLFYPGGRQWQIPACMAKGEMINGEFNNATS